jgi:hypothetical protein
MTIELMLQPEEEAKLLSLAQSRGFTVGEIIREAVVDFLKEQPLTADMRPVATAADIVLKHFRDIPPAERTHRVDGASEHDHYIYGCPKRGD